MSDDPSAPSLPDSGHEPVLLATVLDSLPTHPRVVIDCTVGRGGHSLAIARRLEPGSRLVGIDRDRRNLEFASSRLSSTSHVRFDPVCANFADIDQVLDALSIDRADFVLADLGISTNQVLDARYGLSFANDGPLDMRLSVDDELTAADVVNRMRESELADLIYQYADERFSRRIARKIAEARDVAPITTTRRLAEVVRSAVPVSRNRGKGRRSRPHQIDPATRTFMALRMKVNQEVENLMAFLSHIPTRLASLGRLAVISFHSTEDRLVKHSFRSLAQGGDFRLLSKKPIEPDDAECSANPRARSAKLRAIERIA